MPHHKPTTNLTVSEHLAQAESLIKDPVVETPAGRERSLAITNLQQAKMWFNRARAIETNGKLTETDFDKGGEAR